MSSKPKAAPKSNALTQQQIISHELIVVGPPVVFSDEQLAFVGKHLDRADYAVFVATAANPMA